MYPFSGISYEKSVQKKDPGNGMQCDASDAKKFHKPGSEYKTGSAWAMCRKPGKRLREPKKPKHL
jgi:hypothetical protein